MAGAIASTLPAGGGLGLKPQHFADLLDAVARGAGPAFVEVHPQNYMMAGGPMHRWLAAIAERLPVSFHSVGLSLGDPRGCDRDELDRLAMLCERYQPAMVSDHLSWSRLDDTRIPDLLPLPMSSASLRHFATEVIRVQDRLRRPILIENPSRMLAFADDSWDEAAFLVELCRRTGCGILADVNNLLVSATNVGLSPDAWLDAVDPALIGEYHVAGHAVRRDGPARIAIDDHGSPVGDQCWTLLARALGRTGARPVLLERDNDVPPYADLAAELAMIDAMLSERLHHAA